MQFRDSVLEELDGKYLDMLDGNTPPPISQVSIEDSSQYENNRNGLLGRLAKEAQDFLAAAASVKRLVEARIEAYKRENILEYRERSRFKPCWIIGILALVLLIGATVGICVFNGMEWLTDVFVPNAGFETFWAVFEGPEEPGYWTGAVCVGIVAVIAILLIVLTMATGGDSEITPWIIGGILFMGVLAAILLRLAVAIFGFAIPIIASPIGLALIGIISLVLILIIGRSIMSRKYLKIKRIFVITLIVVSVVCVLLETIHLESFFPAMIEQIFG